MKKLSDYKGEDAIDLWADLLDSIIAIFADEEVSKVTGSGQPPLIIAKTIIKSHKKEAVDILLRIDPTPVDGLNVVIRLLDVINEIEESPEIMDFLGLSPEPSEDKKPSGSATASTKAKGK